MLAQNFKAAADLGITEPQKEALMKTLVLLETGKLTHSPIGEDDIFRAGSHKFTGHFNMHTWAREHDCGTIACIGGTAELVGGVVFGYGDTNKPLHNLFEPRAIDWQLWQFITPLQAAVALRSYLTTGDARWDEAAA
jgi:hypothetical protein